MKTPNKDVPKKYFLSRIKNIRPSMLVASVVLLSIIAGLLFSFGQKTFAAPLMNFLNLSANTAATLQVDDNLAQCPGALYTDIQSAVTAANPNDTIEVCSGTYTVSSTILLNKSGLTLVGIGTKPIVQIPASTGNGFSVTASNVTIDNFEIQKADLLGAPHELILVTGNNFTLQNNTIYGPNPGSPWSVNGLVSRALVTGGGITGILVQNNTIHTLRQPAYFNPGGVGTVSNNNVSGTRGWVVDGATINFTGNTFGPPANQGADIALLPSCNPADYPNLPALSAANDNAVISGQFPGATSGSAVVYVDDSAAPGGIGTIDAPFQTITQGINGVYAGGIVNVASGTYQEDVNVNKAGVTIAGAGVATTIVSGPSGGDGATFRISANNVQIQNFTITRNGNNTTDWNDPNLNSAGIAVQGLTVTGMSIHDNLITGNRSGIDVNNSNGHTIRNNVIDNNRTGLIFRNQTDNLTVVENFITNNWTVGIVFLDASGGTNSPVQTAANSTFSNNNLSANWYGQIVDRQSGGSLSTPGTNIKNFSGNWFGTASPVITTANSAEPGYAAQIPVIYGGTATAPGGQPDIAGPASANFDITPLLASGTDTNVETTPGRGTYGFQGNFGNQAIMSTGAQGVTPTAADNDYTRIDDAIQAATNGSTITLTGTYNWTESNAAASWALGSDGTSATVDDYSIYVPANLNGVTLTASSLGSATIQGPGDLAAINLEGVLVFDGGDNQNWTISNLRFLDFDLSIAFFGGAGGSDAFNNLQLTNNYIRMASDLNATVAPDDVNQNIGIHFAYGTNQVISGNTIEIQGNAVSDGVNFATDVAMQSNTSGGNIYNGLQITNNIIRVLNAQSANPQVILGIWENAHAHTSNITVSGNQFLNMAVGNNPATNLQRAFRVTSHSSGSSTVTYSNNSISGANIGFQWIAGSNFTGNQAVRLTSNNILNGATGVLVQSNGVANINFNRIVGNSVAGVQNVDGIVNAENNWWGCNFGPGAGGAGCSGTANGVTGTVDANPWLTLTTSANPTTVTVGSTSAVTSRLTINSNSVDTSGSGSVPNGTPANFVGTLGSVTPPTGTTTNGVTGTTFTAGATPGNGGVTTTIDGQTVNAAIQVIPTCATVTVPSGQTALSGTTLLVPINVDTVTGRGILSYDFRLTFNPAVLSPPSLTPYDTAGTLSSGFSITTNGNTPGQLIVSGFGTAPLTGSGTLIYIKLNVIGDIGTSSNLNLVNFSFNEGNPCSNTVNGNMSVISGIVSGTVVYGTAPTTTPVKNVTLNAVGSINQTQITDVNGNYTFSGLGAGAYTITPTKTGGVSGISGFDAALVAQFVASIISFNANQITAADVSGNNVITSFDAALIAQYAASIPNSSSTGTWKFIPPSRSYANVQANQTNQNYTAILMGEVSGNWNPATSRPQSTEAAPIAVTIPTVTVLEDANFTVPINVQDTTGSNIISYEFELAYNSSVIQPQAVPVTSVGTLTEGMSVTVNTSQANKIIVVVFSTNPMAGAGTLLKLNFTAVGDSGNSSPLTWNKFDFNENIPQDVTSPGLVNIAAPTGANAQVCGTLMNLDQPNRRIAVFLTNIQTGESYKTIVRGKGNYCFNNVPVGSDYMIQPISDSYQFTPSTRVISVVDTMPDIDFSATPILNRKEQSQRVGKDNNDENVIYLPTLETLFNNNRMLNGKIFVWLGEDKDEE